MQEEEIREALNDHWRGSAAGDAQAEHNIYDDDAICDYPQSRTNLRAKQFAGPTESSSRQAVGLQRQAHARERESLDNGIHNYLSGPASLHSQHHGVPQWQGRARRSISLILLKRRLGAAIGFRGCLSRQNFAN
jgi:hypothetical protein